MYAYILYVLYHAWPTMYVCKSVHIRGPHTHTTYDDTFEMDVYTYVHVHTSACMIYYVHVTAYALGDYTLTRCDTCAVGERETPIVIQIKEQRCVTK